MDIQGVYNTIATEFDHTRHSIWTGVKIFIDDLPPRSIIGDVGIGNGKNAIYAHHTGQHTIMGCDITQAFVDMSKRKMVEHGIKGDVVLGDGLRLPWRDGCLDAVMAVAVIHHLKTPEDRRQFMEELVRVVKPYGGRVLVTAWAAEQPIKTKWRHITGTVSDYMVPWNDKGERFYHLFTKKDMLELIEGVKGEWRLDYEKDNWQWTYRHPKGT